MDFKQPPRHEDVVMASEPLTAEKARARVAAFDIGLARELSEIGLDPFSLSSGGPGSQALDPGLYARYLLDLGRTMGTVGQVTFHAKQTALHALNPETSRIWNPAYFLLRAPIVNSTVRTTIDTETHEELALARELIGPPPTGIQGTRENQNLYTETTAFTDSKFGGPSYQSRGAVDPFEPRVDAELQGLVVDPVSIFERPRASVQFRQDPTIATKTGANSRRLESSRLARAAHTNGVIPQSFPGEGPDALFRHSDQAETGLDDDDAYVPMSFTDLRVGPDGRYRTVFMRPFISSLNESIVPDWNEDQAYGRVDPIMTYKRTTRSVSIGFSLHAMRAADLKIIYNKLHWLTSMAMPEYDSELLIKSGPVVRMRVGDVIRVSGVITSIEYDYSDSIWELAKGAKVPRSIDVSMGLTVVHDRTMGIFGGVFGGLETAANELEARRGGPLGVSVDAGAPTSTVRVERGAFRNFGEPLVDSIQEDPRG